MAEKPEKDEAVTAFSWMQLGAEMLKALASSVEEKTASTADDVRPESIEGRVFAHYVAYNGQHLLALVIEQDDEQGYSQADLAVFTNMKNTAGKKNFGLQFHQDVTYSEMKLPGAWHWIK